MTSSPEYSVLRKSVRERYYILIYELLLSAVLNRRDRSEYDREREICVLKAEKTGVQYVCMSSTLLTLTWLHCHLVVEKLRLLILQTWTVSSVWYLTLEKNTIWIYCTNVFLSLYCHHQSAFTIHLNTFELYLLFSPLVNQLIILSNS